MAYFLISVSNRTNLELCIRHGLAGFTNSVNGLWTFCEVEEGDFISFLYGARVFNLYRVREKAALRNAENLPPWPPVTFRMSGKTYYFPFRAILEPVREFQESMVRPEFAYVAENLLLRGGYRKTHFQADQTTLQSVSQMGYLSARGPELLTLGRVESFIPGLSWNRARVRNPEIFKFQESILQTLLRHFLSNGKNLQNVLASVGLNGLEAGSLEVLGEKALPEGHVDILIKESTPKGISRKVVVEVKLGSVVPQDVDQLCTYMRETGKECLGGLLVGRSFSRRTLVLAKEMGIKPLTYAVVGIDRDAVYTFGDLQKNLLLTAV